MAKAGWRSVSSRAAVLLLAELAVLRGLAVLCELARLRGVAGSVSLRFLGHQRTQQFARLSPNAAYSRK